MKNRKKKKLVVNKTKKNPKIDKNKKKSPKRVLFTEMFSSFSVEPQL